MQGRRLVYYFFLASIVLLTACGKGDGESPKLSETVIPELLLSPANLVLSPGNTRAVTVLSREPDGTVTPWLHAVQWRSKNDEVASVDEQGNITAQQEGSTLIVAESQGASVQLNVVVARTVVVHGVARFEDVLYDQRGQTGSEWKTLRQVPIEVIDPNGVVITNTHTDEEGHYRLELPADGQYLLRLLTATDITADVRVEVAAPTSSHELYAAVQSDLEFTGAEVLLDLEVSLKSELAGAFNVLDALTNAQRFARDLTGQDVPLLRAYWSPSGSIGTFYCNKSNTQACPVGSGIYVLNKWTGGNRFNGVDADHFDDDVLWHEFGHFLMDHFARDDSPGGPHDFTENDLDLRLAWSEGWGNYMATAVKHWLQADTQRATRLSAQEPLTYTGYVDMAAGRAITSIDFGNPGASPYLYVSNEVAIAKMLINTEQLFSANTVWNVVLAMAADSARFTQFESFWDQWRQARPETVSNMQSVLADRSVLYRLDQFEEDDTNGSAREIKPGTTEVHTLYADIPNDEDWFFFNALPGYEFTIATSELRNGADTHIRVYGADGKSMVAENDDVSAISYDCTAQCPPNNGVNLASSVKLRPLQPTTYYFSVRTTRDPYPYPSAGKYGTYTVRLTAKAL